MWLLPVAATKIRMQLNCLWQRIDVFELQHCSSAPDLSNLIVLSVTMEANRNAARADLRPRIDNFYPEPKQKGPDCNRIRH
ncbi:hypothetical protein Q1695_012472 [Nippostrongylus brasiliensis]|nr:hypothetical protein Q1695_012472 [Nippostrongylus brasiliensis]